ncbi:hypothetical protein M427DRAFT_61950 [Gonapodya prolifera JEL478]|uniref:Uncharacterized protein n=1 Tax=Gonapodya prolifera (strain JEL478) TaxID=1344416 RepID=A0A139A1C4_GONPJ|nr:hypothetical protein M427DRAFT_61950 [Gonapodya prolifera JEL478]|eukprot:KXS10587.1 hypothetical protein M427DRAFT_61950 [Gonapodya prolifera JEL478]
MPTYNLLYPCPIPIGHRVSVTVYSRPKNGLFGTKGRVTVDKEPVVVDLDTGVEYAPAWLYGYNGMTSASGMHGVGPNQLVGVKTEKVEQGVVRQCRIFTNVGGDLNQWMQTFLTTE